MPANQFELIRSLIRDNALEEAIFQLQALKPVRRVRIEINTLASRYNLIERQHRLNLVEMDYWQREINNINYSLLHIVDSLQYKKSLWPRGFTNLTNMAALILIACLMVLLYYYRPANPENLQKTKEPAALQADSLRLKQSSSGGHTTLNDMNKEKRKEISLPPYGQSVAAPQDKQIAEAYSTCRIIIRYTKLMAPRIFINRQMVEYRDTLFPNNSHGLLVDFSQAKTQNINLVEIFDRYGNIACRDSFPFVSASYQQILPCY